MNTKMQRDKILIVLRTAQQRRGSLLYPEIRAEVLREVPDLSLLSEETLDQTIKALAVVEGVALGPAPSASRPKPGKPPSRIPAAVVRAPRYPFQP